MTNEPKNEFDITEAAGRRVLWIDSNRLREYLDAYRAGTFSAIGINTARGYKASDIDFLARCEFIRDVEIVPGLVPLSLAPLKQLRRLRTLILSGDSSELRISEFPELEELRTYWHPRLLAAHSQLRLLDISNYKPVERDLTSLPSLPQLCELTLVKANLTSLKGVSNFPTIRKLDLALLSKLESLHDVNLLPDLSWLECDRCRAMRNVEEVVGSVSSLRVLRLNSCSPLSSLRFLDGLPNLEEFRFVGTNVRDGDLTPLTRLKRVGFLRKRGFSHTPEQIEALIRGPT